MFLRAKQIIGSTPVYEYAQLADGEAGSLGEAVKFVSGKLTKAGPTDVPEGILQASVGAATPGGFTQFERTTEDIEYETTAAVTVAPARIGAKVTLGTDGLTITATTTTGVFSVSGTDGKTGGGKVRGYFRR